MLGQPYKITMPCVLLCIILYLLLLPFIQYPLTTIIKPIPIALLMRFTWQIDFDKRIHILLLVALGFSLIGDILLTLPTKISLHLGILSFMLTHCFYIVIFLRKIAFKIQNLYSFLPVLIFVSISLFCLWPYLGDMRIPVIVYLLLLTSMVFCAFQVKQYSMVVRFGACLFLLSDFILALSLFVLPNNKLMAIVIMLLYYLAQIFLVLGITETKDKIFHELQKLCRNVTPVSL